MRFSRCAQDITGGLDTAFWLRSGQVMDLAWLGSRFSSARCEQIQRLEQKVCRAVRVCEDGGAGDWCVSAKTSSSVSVSVPVGMLGIRSVKGAVVPSCRGCIATPSSAMESTGDSQTACGRCRGKLPVRCTQGGSMNFVCQASFDATVCMLTTI